MHIQESGEMYLETIYFLSKTNENVRAIDIGEHLGYSKPSVSRAVHLLKDGGFITVANCGKIELTDTGLEVALKISERHTLMTKFLTAIGVDEKTAAEDACKMEHVISDRSFEAIKHHAEKMMKSK